MVGVGVGCWKIAVCFWVDITIANFSECRNPEKFRFIQVNSQELPKLDRFHDSDRSVVVIQINSFLT
ncbi:MAG: hypothetical protein F6K11_14080 [Leptolyngbya sp. SIO3F4]|nr:hypothetical protein [Leptolyngbya sp. SIO3F4]